MVISVHEGCELYALHRSLLNRHVDSQDFRDVKYAEYDEDHGPSNDRKYEFRYPEPTEDESAGDSSTTERKSNAGQGSTSNTGEGSSDHKEEQAKRSIPQVIKGRLGEEIDFNNLIRKMQKDYIPT